MNQERIGKFILELRKEKNMTQKELANIIGVTDRAVSKWERGVGLPDLSLLIPLSSTLGVSVNELLSGKRLSKEDIASKSEDVIKSTINYSSSKLKKTKLFIKVLLIILIFLVVIITLFGIDFHRIKNNLPVVFSTWGYDYSPPINIEEDNIYSTIKEYLVSISDQEEKKYENEKAFASIEVFLIEETIENEEYNVYGWVLLEKYYKENNKVLNSMSYSSPYKFVIKSMENGFTVLDSRTPRDGAYYEKDINVIFPKDVISAIDKVNTDGTINGLSLDIKNDVNLYFK